MRKYIRNILRYEGEKREASPSIWVRTAFHTHQLKRYGAKKRRINQAKGTHPKRVWRQRIALSEAQ